MAKLDYKQVYALAREAGFDPPHAVIATAIAFAESGGRTDAVGDVTLQTSKWGPSIGLWQVRSLKAEYGKGTVRDASRLTDPRYNARSAYAISGQGRSFAPWSTFTNGAWLANRNPASIAGENVETGGKGSSVLAGIPSLFGSIITAPLGGIGGMPGVGDAIGGAAKAVTSVPEFLAALMRRSTYLRVVQVVAGIGAVALGVVVLKGELTAGALGALAGGGKGGGAGQAAAGAVASKAAAAAL